MREVAKSTFKADFDGGREYYPSVTLIACQLPAGNPVAALAVHRTTIHYRHCASLTPDKGSLGRMKFVSKTLIYL